MQQENPRNHEPQDHEQETQSDDSRKTRLNRVPINDSERDPGAAHDPSGEKPPPSTGGFGDAGNRFGTADDERYDSVHSPGGGGYDSSGGSMRGMSPAGAISPQDEKTWSVLSHLSILVSLVTGIGGFVAALVIWLVYKDRSPRVGFHALQSLWYQVAWTGIIIAFGVVATVLSLVTFGLAAVLLIPLGILLAIVPFVHQCYAAYKISQGVDYRYPIIADMIDGSRRFG